MVLRSGLAGRWGGVLALLLTAGSVALAEPAAGGDLRLRLNGDLLDIEFDSTQGALASATGSVLSKLRLPDLLFDLSPAAGCALRSARADGIPGTREAVRGRYHWQCANPQALRDIRLRGFNDFPHLGPVQVSFNGPLGTRAGRLDRQNPHFGW